MASDSDISEYFDKLHERALSCAVLYYRECRGCWDLYSVSFDPVYPARPMTVVALSFVKRVEDCLSDETALDSAADKSSGVILVVGSPEDAEAVRAAIVTLRLSRTVQHLRASKVETQMRNLGIADHIRAAVSMIDTSIEKWTKRGCSASSIDAMAFTLPTLYCLDKGGKEREWSVSVKGNLVIKSHGLVSGKKVTTQRAFQGVNVGRKNETCAEQQAQLQALRDWTKQLDKKYKPKTKDGMAMYKRAMAEKAAAGGNNHAVTYDETPLTEPARKAPKVLSNAENGSAPTVETQVVPMKAQVWEPVPKVLKYFDFAKGVYVQAKFDGVRCTATVQSDGTVVLLSNTSKQFLWHKTIRASVAQLLGELRDVTLDGELYAHKLVGDDGKELTQAERFGIITGACRSVRGEPSPFEEQMCYYVFDIVDAELPQSERTAVLDELFDGWDDPRIVKVETHTVYSADEISNLHDTYAQQGFEGVIIRAHDMMYQQKHRSTKMRKYKHFIDDEFEVTGVELDAGVDKEFFVWLCKTVDGKKFKAKPDGPRELKVQWYDDAKKYVGKMLTVKYQELTADGVPRFPIGKGFRAAEDM